MGFCTCTTLLRHQNLFDLRFLAAVAILHSMTWQKSVNAPEEYRVHLQSLTLKMEAMFCFKMPIDFHRTTKRYITEDRNILYVTSHTVSTLTNNVCSSVMVLFPYFLIFQVFPYLLSALIKIYITDWIVLCVSYINIIFSLLFI
jgi:hypothetical protein